MFHVKRDLCAGRDPWRRKRHRRREAAQARVRRWDWPKGGFAAHPRAALGRGGGFLARSGTLQAPKALHIVSDRRKMDLQPCLSEADPAHAAEIVAALPRAEDFFDARTNPPQRAVMRFERARFEPAMALAQQPRSPAGAILTSASFAGVVSTARIIPVSLSAAIWAL